MSTHLPASVDLNGPWQFVSSCGSYCGQTAVPGTVFQTLEAQGLFGPRGLAWREENRRCQDIAEREFTFSLDFEAAAPFTAAGADGGQRVFLECDGLDTLAGVFLNGRLLGWADNMHRQWRFPVEGALRPGTNRLELRFANSLEQARRAAARRPLWNAYEGHPDLAAPHFNQLRKSHCSFGWDWGPIVPDVGPWRAVRLAAYPGLRLDSLAVAQEHADGAVTLDIQAELEWLDALPNLPAPDQPAPWALSPLPVGPAWERVTAPAPGLGVQAAAALRRALDAGMRVEGSLIHPDGRRQDFSWNSDRPVRLAVDRPQLWWPRGLGAQPLYRLEARVIAQDGQVLASREQSLGLRTLGVRREADQWGESFEFVCNGLPFFARGANYIPQDYCLARVDAARIRRLLGDCAEANFNLVRVWGGAVYPDDVFFDTCDELGLVVWQDLMFACAVYDVANPRFMASVTAELRDNLRRLRHHPSLGLVCGNNEMEMAFVDWSNFTHNATLRAEYLAQYEVLFPQILAQEAPAAFYWPASPSSGGGFERPNAPERGDCHYWDVWHGFKDFDDLTRHYFRFMSEFGFESFPDLKTVAEFTLPEDRNLTSPVMEDHQRCLLGTGKMAYYLARYFRAPKDFDAAVLVSQVNQAEALRTGIEHWRRHRGRCMGSIYWQLNDNWPVASWSSIDSAGRWKALHYAAKRAYAPFMISVATRNPPGAPAGAHPPADSPLLAWHAVNETPAALRGVLSWRLVSCGGRELAAGQTAFALPPFSAQPVAEFDATPYLPVAAGDARPSPRRDALLFYRWEAEAAPGTAAGTELGGQACHAFAPWKLVELAPAVLAAEVKTEADGTLAVTVRTDQPALFVHLDHAEHDLVWHDDWQCLDGQTPGVWRLHRGPDGLSAEGLAAGLRLWHLRQSYD